MILGDLPFGLADVNWQAGTIGEWISGVMAGVAVIVALVATRNERRAHAEATKALEEQRAIDRERAEQEAQAAADVVVFAWSINWSGIPGEIHAFSAVELRNPSPTAHFYELEIFVIDAERPDRQLGPRVALAGRALKPGENLAVHDPYSGLRESQMQLALSAFGIGVDDITANLGIRITIEELHTDLPVDLVLEYSDAANRRWRKTRTEPARRAD